MKMYKFLTAGGRGPYSGSPWNLPTEDGPGEWMPAIDGEVVACKRGYHAASAEQVLEWLDATAYTVESQSQWMDVGGKWVTAGPVRLVRQLPWDDRRARLFACDCVERVLPVFESAYPDDSRPRRAVDDARLFAVGQATEMQLDAAGAAARAAAWAAARAAAWDAARRWQTWRLLEILEGAS